jgi:hypothetical protein
MIALAISAVTVGRVLYQACDMVDEKGIRRAALITVRRAILERFPAGS